MSKWYGSLTNRLEEGQNFTGREIRTGDDITMYLWSDRNCYFVVGVESQKRIKVRRYYTCADHEKPGGMGHQDWMYFKTWDEWNEYLSKYHPEYHDPKEHRDEPDPQVWVFRYGKWMQEITYTDENYCTDREKKSLEKNGFYKRYFDLTGRVSFGVLDYYYDWEF